MTGFRGDPDPSDDWISEEVRKQKERDQGETEEAVVVVDDLELRQPLYAGNPDDDDRARPQRDSITPEAYREVGLEKAREAFSRGLVLVDLGREWLDSIGYRDETRQKALDAWEGLSHVIDLIGAGEGVSR